MTQVRPLPPFNPVNPASPSSMIPPDDQPSIQERLERIEAKLDAILAKLDSDRRPDSDWKPPFFPREDWTPPTVPRPFGSSCPACGLG